MAGLKNDITQVWRSATVLRQQKGLLAGSSVTRMMAQRKTRQGGYRLIHKVLKKDEYARHDLMDDINMLISLRLRFGNRLGYAAVQAAGSSDAIANGSVEGIRFWIFSTRDELHLFFRAKPPADGRVKRALEYVFNRGWR